MAILTRGSRAVPRELIIVAALVVSCGGVVAAASAEALPRVFILDGMHLRAVRQRVRAGDTNLAPALTQLERDAKEALSATPFSVVNKISTPPSGDKHDYMSQAPYFWPNPDTADGLPYIRRDGERNPGISRISDHRTLDQMAESVETLALAYYFKGNEPYADKAAQLMRVWFFDPSTRMNPNLQYAQAVLGVNNGRGIGIIESRALTRVVDAVGLLAGSKAWTKSDQRKLEEWFAQYLKWMQESKNGREECAAKNNHGTYWDVQAASFALFLGKKERARDIINTAKQKRIALQIEPDGRQPLELVRTKAWGYSVGNLSGLMLLARLGENVGVDLWHFQTADGRRIAKALDFLGPFCFWEKKWPYQQIGGWPPQMLHPLVRQAALKLGDPKYAEWAKKLPAIEPDSRGNLLRPKVGERVDVNE
jgi:hypothetical protein